MTTMLDRFEGCLLGGAMGDALGYPVEFRRDGFGYRGVRQLQGNPAKITDDTQMTLFGAEAIVLHATEPVYWGTMTLAEAVEAAYQRWLRTQRFTSVKGLRVDGQPHPGLLGHDFLWASRAPGGTCLRGLATGIPVKNSKGNGGVMRAAPFGLQLGKSPRRCFHDAVDAARVTHGHPDGYLPAGAAAALIRLVVAGFSYKAACWQVLRILRDWKHSQETQRMIKIAMGLSVAVTPATSFAQKQRMIECFPTSWTGEATLGISLFCVLATLRSGGSFLDAISLAASNSHDSDTNGAVTGNLAGVLGKRVLPPGWEDQLEGHDVISEMAGDLLLASAK